MITNDNIDDVVFSGVKFGLPMSNALRSMDISNGTPIQLAAIPSLTMGQSAVLHAETGSGKTLTYLLPLLKRLYHNDNKNGDFGDDKNSGIQHVPLQALIIVPTKELAVQVAGDIVSLTMNNNNVDKEVDIDSSMVDLCITTKRKGLQVYKSPIVVGTPAKIYDSLQYTDKSAFISLSYLVLDEVDRLLNVMGKYASNDKKREIRSKPSDTIRILESLTDSRSIEDIQLVCASATVGRPLRRQLANVFHGNYQANLPVIRRADSPTSGRAVGIPDGIQHEVIMFEAEDDASNPVNQKLGVAKERFLKDSSQRTLLFVPTINDVEHSVGMLNFWGVKALNIQSMLGITSTTNRPRPGKRGHSSKSNSNDGRLTNIGSSFDKMINNAAQNRVGTASKLNYDDHDDKGNKSNSDMLYVASFTGTRGLHLEDIELVVITEPPHTMDEYLHISGRTGRAGKEGKVVTFVTLDDLKRMKSWETALGIQFKIST